MAASLQPDSGQFYSAFARVGNANDIAANTTKIYTIAGQGGLPASGIEMVALNIAAKGATTTGSLMVYPTGNPAETTTANAYRTNIYTQNLILAKVGSDGKIRIINRGSGTVRVYIDLHGYTLSQSGPAPGSTFIGTDPVRIASVTIGANSNYVLSPLGQGGIPTSGVSQVAFTLAARSTSAGKITVYASGDAKPAGTNTDYGLNIWTQNYVIAKLGVDGKIIINNAGSGSVSVTVDVAGYYVTPGFQPAGSRIRPIDPALSERIAEESQEIAHPQVLGTAGIPSTGVSGVALNFTATGTQTGALRVAQSGLFPIVRSHTVGLIPNTVVSGFKAMIVGPPASIGAIDVFNDSSGDTDVTIDAFGYFQPPGAPGRPTVPEAAAGDGQATVSWQPPKDGGSAITKYTITPEPDGSPIEVGGDQTSATVTGLTNGQGYKFTVSATNAIGAGPESDSSPQVFPRTSGSPRASFSVACDNAASTCDFDASESTDPDGTITSYDWDFDDGGVGNGKTTSHKYASGGKYTVTLTVTDDAGLVGATQRPVTLNMPPTAAFTISCANSTLACSFDASQSTDSDGTITTYAWDFGDGQGATGKTVSHTYQSAGTKTVKLTVTDDKGAAASSARNLTVSTSNIPPIASFNVACTDSNLSCAFDGSASEDPDGTITRYAWDFGDGTTSSSEFSPTAPHVYAIKGTYTVKLTVTDDKGATGLYTKQVTVGETGSNIPPTARFSFVCLDQLDCYFDAEGSSDEDGTITKYEWSFGDGSTGVGPTVDHTYVASGTYTVTLQVTDDKGATGSFTKQANPR